MLAQIIRFYGHAMQGMMGAYLEKNLQTFAELQKRFAASGMGLNDAKALHPRDVGAVHDRARRRSCRA